MNVSQTHYSSIARSLHPRSLTCPYWKKSAANCPASIMAMAIPHRRKSLYCRTEDFDRCPIFLAKVLRGA